MLEHLIPLEKADFDIKLINSSEVNEQNLEKVNVITFPGGADYRDYLDNQAIIDVKSFVSKGGGFVGTCSGAAFAIDIGLLVSTHDGWRIISSILGVC